LAATEAGGRVGGVKDERNRKVAGFAGEEEVVGGEGGVVFPLYKAFQHRNRTPHVSKITISIFSALPIIKLSL
jgi:hypothetical protein